ncbi:MAG: AMP-binding protein [Betaproteobacteria bacterium]|nr:AMP-binding protein [Betaproteobacteria bacterium]
MTMTRDERRAHFPAYWDEARETMSGTDRERLILGRVQAQLRYAYDQLPFYRDLYDRHRFRPEHVESMRDFARVPIVTKQMLRDDQAKHPPFGSYSNTPLDQVSRIFGSSGTTGVPTLYAVSKEDWTRAIEAQAMAIWGMGVRPGDVVHFVFPFGMFVGGWAIMMGVERVGATIFPVGAADSRRQIDLIGQMKPTVIAGTPSYVLHLADVARSIGVDLRNSGIHTLIVGGEPGGTVPGMTAAMRAGWGDHVTICDTGNTSECFPTQMNSSCDHGTGVHIYEDEVYLEIVDPEDPGRPLPDGEYGATVYTTLWRRSQPMIRFYAGDRARLLRERCSCGRTFPRLPEGMVGRLDDMLLIRGANVYPSAVESALRQIPGVGQEYRIMVEKAGALDEMRLEVEPAQPALMAESAAAARGALEQAIVEELRRHIGLRVDVRMVAPGTFEAMLFKSRRVVDLRKAAQ